MTRERLLENISAQVERVRNNGARRRLRKALEAAKAKRARTLEIERRRADRARTLTVDGPPVGILSLAHDLAVQRAGWLPESVRSIMAAEDAGPRELSGAAIYDRQQRLIRAHVEVVR